MRLENIIRVGWMAQERSVASIAAAPIQSSQESHILCFLNASFALRIALQKGKNGYTGKITQGIEMMREGGIVVAHTGNGLMRFSIETAGNAVSAARAALNCMRTTSRLGNIILSYVLKSQTDSLSALSVTGTCILHKMKKRLIRWIPYQIMLGAIPSQASGETCLKV
jgi:hypothetical protein